MSTERPIVGHVLSLSLSSLRQVFCRYDTFIVVQTQITNNYCLTLRHLRAPCLRSNAAMSVWPLRTAHINGVLEY